MSGLWEEEWRSCLCWEELLMIGGKRIKGVFFALVIGLAVVSFWRGAWQLMDLFVFPNDYLLSNIVSIVVGFVILVLAHRAIREFL